MYMATFLTELITGIGIPTTTVKPPQNENNDLDTLIYSVVNLYHPEITEQSNDH